MLAPRSASWRMRNGLGKLTVWERTWCLICSKWSVAGRDTVTVATLIRKSIYLRACLQCQRAGLRDRHGRHGADPQAHDRRLAENNVGFRNLKRTPSDTPPPTGLLLTLHKIILRTRNQARRSMRRCGPFSFKPPHRTTFHLTRYTKKENLPPSGDPL